MIRRRRMMAVLLLAIAPLPRVAGAVEEGPEPVRYTLRFPRPAEHVVEVEADLPTGGGESLTAMMPVWTPGSYLVREFAGDLETIGASGPEGEALKVEKVAKNRWTVETGGAGRVVVRYSLFARDPSVRTNWVDPAFALLNGASTYLTIADDEGMRPHEVIIEMPAGWPESVTTLEAVEGGPYRYRADSFDALVDAPIVLGNPAVYEFEVDGVPHRLVNVDEGGVWDGARSVADLEKVVAAARDVWGELPYDEYVFFNILTGGGGGIEHRESTVMMADRWASRSDSSYLHWLGLAAHEHFHAWNVKRLRPAALGPFDYEEENYTRSLWVAEGITTYYSLLILRRAGLCDADQFLSGPGGFGLSTLVERLEEAPGRLVQPLAEASFDAWIKFYRPGPNSRESTVSYYTKGAVVGFLLDAEIRRATEGAKSLDDLMRLAFERYSARPATRRSSSGRWRARWRGPTSPGSSRGRSTRRRSWTTGRPWSGSASVSSRPTATTAPVPRGTG